MALETLKDVKEIDGFKVSHIDVPIAGGYKGDSIGINHGTNCIDFVLQNGPIKENGVNGCQVDTVITAVKMIIEKLNEQFPCRENSMTITKLDEALMWLKKRKTDREARGVEGFNKA